MVLIPLGVEDVKRVLDVVAVLEVGELGLQRLLEVEVGVGVVGFVEGLEWLRGIVVDSVDDFDARGDEFVVVLVGGDGEEGVCINLRV